MEDGSCLVAGLPGATGLHGAGVPVDGVPAPAVHQKENNESENIAIMKTKKNKRCQYKKPRITRVKLDNEISLVMVSEPKGNPPWGSNETPGSNRDPFKPDDYHG